MKILKDIFKLLIMIISFMILGAAIGIFIWMFFKHWQVIVSFIGVIVCFMLIVGTIRAIADL